MPSYELRWEVAGAVQLARNFGRLAVELTDYREPLRAVGKIVYAENRHQFEAEGDPKWPELSPGYARWKARKAPGHKILSLTGATEESLTSRTGGHAVYSLHKLWLELGSSLMVGKYNLPLIHYKPIRARVPRRRMMLLRESAQTRAVEAFSDWYSRKGREMGVGL